MFERKASTGNRRTSTASAPAPAPTPESTPEPELPPHEQGEKQWTEAHIGDGVVPFLPSRMEAWGVRVWHALGFPGPNLDQQTQEKALRFMHEGVYDMMDVIVSVMSDLFEATIQGRYEKKSLIEKDWTGPTRDYLTTLRDVFEQTRYAYTPERLGTMLLLTEQRVAALTKKSQAPYRQLQGMLAQNGNPDVMVSTAWAALGMEADKVPPRWKPYLAALESHIQVMYVASLYAEEKLEEEEALTDNPDQKAWRRRFLWQTPGFEEEGTWQETAVTYKTWVRTPRPGMLQTLGVLHYAMVTTLARLQQGDDESEVPFISKWQQDITQKLQRKAQQ